MAPLTLLAAMLAAPHRRKGREAVAALAIAVLLLAIARALLLGAPPEIAITPFGS